MISTRRSLLDLSLERDAKFMNIRNQRLCTLRCTLPSLCYTHLLTSCSCQYEVHTYVRCSSALTRSNMNSVCTGESILHTTRSTLKLNTMVNVIFNNQSNIMTSSWKRSDNREIGSIPSSDLITSCLHNHQNTHPH